MFSKNIDFLAIGDITTDAFIRLQDAKVTCDINNSHCTLSMKFADKVPYEFMEEVRGVGNSANAAVSAARLGLSSVLVTSIGDDENGKNCLTELKKNNVGTQYMDVQKNTKTNYHYVLWYEAERTILVKHENYKYHLPVIKPPRWIYLSSLGASSYPTYHWKIAEYLKKHPEVKLAFQPGTFQMDLGVEKMREFYERSEVFIVNREESQRILKTTENDIEKLLHGIHKLGPKIVLITDGPKGAYMYDGIDSWYMPIYPDPKPPYERTGCGDAFASTFVAALIHGKSVQEALRWAPINPMSVVQHVGAQKGLLTKSQLENLLKHKPQHYKSMKISN